MNRRGIREGLVGLLILVGVGIFAGLYLWISGGLRQTGYRFTVALLDANGLSVGAQVRLRGVRVGQIERLTPRPSVVQVEVLIDRPDVLVPKDSEFVVSQSGLIGETFIEIFPAKQASLPTDLSVKDLEERCEQNPQTITAVCPGATVEGYTPTRFQELVRSLDALATRLDEKFLDTLEDTLTRFGRTADDVGVLARKVSVTADALTTTVQGAGQEVRSLGSAARALEKTATNIDTLVAADRKAIDATVNNLEATSRNFRTVSQELNTSLSRENLQKIVANTDATVANLKTLSAAVSDPGTIASLRETLDKARATLANVNQITAEVQELTGDPKFRTNLRRLVEGLGNLVSAEPGDGRTQPAVFTPGSVADAATLVSTP